MNNQQLAQQMAQMDPTTQATLGKYGIQPMSGNPLKISQGNVTVNNTTYTTTHNNVKISQPSMGAPVISQPQIQMRSGDGQNSVAKFKTWMSNAFARQREESVAREKEFKKKEWSLSRSASRMMRGLEKLGKGVYENLDPRKLSASKVSSLQMLSWLMTIGTVAKFWPEIVKGVGKAVEWLKGIASWMGFNNGTWQWKGSGLQNFLGNIFGNPSNPTQGFFETFWSPSGGGIINGLLDGIKGWFNEMGDKIRDLPIPQLPRSSGSTFSGLLNTLLGAMEGMMGFFKNVVVATISSTHTFQNLQSGDNLDKSTLSSITTLFSVGSKKNRVPSGSLNDENSYSYDDETTVYIKNDKGEIKKITVGEGDNAVLDVRGDNHRQDYLQKADLNDSGNLSNNLGASARMSSAMVSGSYDPSRFNYFIVGMNKLQELSKRTEDFLVVDEFVEALEKYYDVDINKFFKKKKTKKVVVDQDELNKYKWLDYHSVVSDGLSAEGIMSSLGSLVGLQAIDPHDVALNSEFQKQVIIDVPVDSNIGLPARYKDGTLYETKDRWFLDSSKFEELSNYLLDKLGISSGEGRYWGNSNVDLQTRAFQYLIRRGKDYSSRFRREVGAGSGDVIWNKLKKGLSESKDVEEAYYLDRYGVSPFYENFEKFKEKYPKATKEYFEQLGGTSYKDLSVIQEQVNLLNNHLKFYDPPSRLFYGNLDDDKGFEKFIDYLALDIEQRGYPYSYSLPISGKSFEIGTEYRNSVGGNSREYNEALSKYEQDVLEELKNSNGNDKGKNNIVYKGVIYSSVEDKIKEEERSGEVVSYSGVGVRRSNINYSGDELWPRSVWDVYNWVQNCYNSGSGDNVSNNSDLFGTDYTGTRRIDCSGTVSQSIACYWYRLKQSNSPKFNEEVYNNYVKNGGPSINSDSLTDGSTDSLMSKLGFQKISYSPEALQPWDICAANKAGGSVRAGHVAIVGNRSGTKWQYFSATMGGGQKGSTVIRDNKEMTYDAAYGRRWSVIWRLKGRSSSNFSTETTTTVSKNDSTVAAIDGTTFAKPTTSGTVSSNWGADRGNHTHKGVDISVPEGTPVYAIKSGTVGKIGDKSDGDAGGNRITINHDDGTQSFYAHLKDGGILVKTGDHIEMGQQIAVSGNTGTSSGPHLHLSYSTSHSINDRVDPSKYLHSSFKVGGGYESLPSTITTTQISNSNNESSEEEEEGKEGGFGGALSMITDYVKNFFKGIENGLGYLIDLENEYQEQKNGWKPLSDKDAADLINYYQESSKEDLWSMVDMTSEGNIAKRLSELDPKHEYNIQYSDSEAGKFTLFVKDKKGIEKLESKKQSKKVKTENEEKKLEDNTLYNSGELSELLVENVGTNDWHEISKEDYENSLRYFEESGHQFTFDDNVNITDLNRIDPDFNYKKEYKEENGLTEAIYYRQRKRPLKREEDHKEELLGEEGRKKDTTNEFPLQTDIDNENDEVTSGSWKYMREEDIVNAVQGILDKDIPEEDRQKLQSKDIDYKNLASLLSKYDSDFDYSYEIVREGGKEKMLLKRRPKQIIETDGGVFASMGEVLEFASEGLANALREALEMPLPEEMQAVRGELLGTSSSSVGGGGSLDLANNILEGKDPNANLVDITKAGVKKVNEKIKEIELTIDSMWDIAAESKNVISNQNYVKNGGNVMSGSRTMDQYSQA